MAHIPLAIKILPTVLIVLLLTSTPAYAYLDPGTGSLLFAAISGLVASAYFAFKGLVYRLSSLIGIINKTSAKHGTKYGIVLYSEGNQYHSTFAPLIQALAERNTPCVYLSSDPDDPGLHADYPLLETEFIGRGNLAYRRLNWLQADLCVFTTPGLDVLQIRRSSGVKHYCHIVHAPTDIWLYELFSFDYFDTVMCSGEHQIRSLRALEQKRGTPPKTLLKTGCVYFDGLLKLARVDGTANPSNPASSARNLLIAPTWGQNSLLARYGNVLLHILLDAGHRVIVRPHPQSFVSDKTLINHLEKTWRGKANLQWDTRSDAYPSMAAADMLISDISGIIFDYAFVLEKPVITIAAQPDLCGKEAIDLPEDETIWELDAIGKLSTVVPEAQIDHLPAIIQQLSTTPFYPASQTRQLCTESVFNFGAAGPVAAEQLIAIRQGLGVSSGT